MIPVQFSYSPLGAHSTTLVRSHLDYAISLWSPYKQNYKDAIENVQRRATKQLPCMKNIPYQERLEILKLPTLAYRRSRGGMIGYINCLKGNVTVMYLTLSSCTKTVVREKEQGVIV